MASSSSTVSVFDAHRFRKAHNEQLFDSYARGRKVILEVGFNLEDDEYPEIMEQIELRGWRRLAAPRTDISKLLVRTELQPLARGWQEFIIHSLVPTGNKSEITTSRATLIHTIMQGEDVRAEEIIADNMVTIAQGLPSKGNIAHPSTIYKLCKDAGVPLREFASTPRIPLLSYITAKRMETIRFPRHQQPQQQEDEEEEGDEPMPQADGGNFEEEDQQPPQQNQPSQQDRQPQQHGFQTSSQDMKANTMRTFNA
ncbi:hypothetical protein PIB30_104534 [Stylosanthes scabra]|uniref:Putative plant transposon protein domain-containing protein n=1 Tax=Stylosanthes scabra TaxID=79078 RepID=A0ABU6VWU8_9FABA|nr:hypothetical protein [Stylosanthes scabra]